MEERNSYNNVAGKPEGKRPLADLGVDRRIILKSISGKQGGKVWTGFIWLRIGTSCRFLLRR
jgi:hypothetical protein